MDADLDVTVDLVRALLREQHPDLAGLPLRTAAHGWDNAVLRLGDGLAVRVPRREAAAGLVRHEQEWLGRLAPALPVPVPAPVRVGRPSDALGYPWAWSVVPWFDGVPADTTPVARRTAWAGDLGRFLVALHRPAPADAPENPYRGVPLAERDAVLRERVDRLGPRRDAALRLWDDCLAAPEHDGPPVWLHGDPHPANLVVAPGRRAGDGTGPGAGTTPDRLAAVVDLGDLTSGDPASDLATAWLTFDAAGHATFRAAVDAGSGWDAATWRRARGWAVLLTTALLAFPGTFPHLAMIGEHALDQLLPPG